MNDCIKCSWRLWNYNDNANNETKETTRAASRRLVSLEMPQVGQRALL